MKRSNRVAACGSETKAGCPYAVPSPTTDLYTCNHDEGQVRQIRSAYASPGGAKKEKPKSETYEQAWPVPEQRILERLLSENFDSEKNRYERLFFLAVRENT